MFSHGNFPNFPNFPNRLFLDFFSFILVNLSLSWWKIVEIFTNLKKKYQKKRFWKFGKFPWFHKEIFQIFKIFQIAFFLIFFFYFGQSQSILVKNSQNFTNLNKKTQKKAILKIWKISMVSHGNFPNFPNCLFLDFFLLFWSICLSWWKTVEIFTNLKKNLRKSDFENLENFHGFAWKFSKFSKSLVSWFFSFIFFNLSLSWWKIVVILQI